MAHFRREDSVGDDGEPDEVECDVELPIICPIEIAANISAFVTGKIAHLMPTITTRNVPATHQNASWIKWRSLRVMNE